MAPSFSEDDSDGSLFEADYAREWDDDDDSEPPLPAGKIQVQPVATGKGAQIQLLCYSTDESDIEEETDATRASLRPWSYMTEVSAPARISLELELGNKSSSMGSEHILGLLSLRLLVAQTAESQAEDWYSPTEQNPLHLFKSEAMVHIDVMERVVLYLHAHSLLVPGLKQHTLLVRPYIYQVSLCQQPALKGSLRDIVWKQATSPSYVIVPVVVDEPLDHRDPRAGRRMHWYIWFGFVVQVNATHQVRFHYLDSLPTPNHTEMAERRRRLQVVMAGIMPELKVVWDQNDPVLEHYRQKPGSLDCGVFVAQAVSALLFEDPSALTNPLPASVVRARIERILSACKSGLMPHLAEGYRPDLVTLLHQTRLASTDGFYSVNSLAPSPLQSTSSPVSTARPPPWQKEATKQYKSKLLIGAMPPLPRSLSIEAAPSRSAPSPRTAVHIKETKLSERHGSTEVSSASPQRRASELSIRRFSPYKTPPERSMSTASGMSYVYGRHGPHAFEPVEEGVYAPFFRELRGDMCTWGVGQIQSVRERDMEQILIGAFMRDGPVPSRLPAGISIVEGLTQDKPADQDNAMSIREFVTAVRDIESHEERDRAILTGVHRGEVLNLDWRKDSLNIEEDWLDVTVDIDSLSLTVDDPQFTASVTLQLYPARATTMTSDNRLRVDVDGTETPLSHSRCPTTLCLLTH